MPIDEDALTAELKSLRDKIKEQDAALGDLKSKAALTSVLDHLKTNIANQTTAGLVEKFNGRPAKFNQWIKSVERAAAVSFGIPDSTQLAHAALLSSEGIVADFLLRFIAKEKNYYWSDLIKQLRDRFGEKVDVYSQILTLRKLRQKNKQTPHAYAEYLQVKANEVYTAEELDTPLLQRELVSTFCSGLVDTNAAVRILRKGPVTLLDAVTLANQELLISSRVAAHGFGGKTTPRHDEPMEIDALGAVPKKTVPSVKMQKRPGNCYKCGKPGHWQATCRVKVTRPQTSKVTADKVSVTCFYCKKVGHYVRDCRKKKADMAGAQRSGAQKATKPLN